MEYEYEKEESAVAFINSPRMQSFLKIQRELTDSKEELESKADYLNIGVLLSSILGLVVLAKISIDYPIAILFAFLLMFGLTCFGSMVDKVKTKWVNNPRSWLYTTKWFPISEVVIREERVATLQSEDLAPRLEHVTLQYDLLQYLSKKSSSIHESNKLAYERKLEVFTEKLIGKKYDAALRDLADLLETMNASENKESKTASYVRKLKEKMLPKSSTLKDRL